ncbi:phosphate carrier protein, mitochondrial isoform X2, partial [Clarias magur]
MAEFLEDPSILTKDKLKSELLANDVALPSGEHRKDVYVQLYLKHLTALNKKHSANDTFSSDEEITPIVSNRSRSGKKATKKTDKTRKEELDVASLTDSELRDQLMKCGINPGPISATTRRLYERRLQNLLDKFPLETTPPEPETAVPETVPVKADGSQNGNTHTTQDEYSDKEEEFEPVPEPVPVASKPVRSRGKTPVTTRTSSRHSSKIETTAADELSFSVDRATSDMYPSTLLHLARANPFSAPLFTLQKTEEPSRPAADGRTRRLAAASVAEGDSCEFGSQKYFLLCGFGGILSCGTTHTAVVPLDLVKCRMQVDPAKYKSIFNGFSVTIREDGVRGLAKGWAPTFIGYSMQGLCKFGFYEVFKIFYGDMLGEENAYMWRTSLYLAASASAEFFADIALAPMEACKVRIQTQPGYANTLRDCAPKMYAEEGLWAFYKGVVPLWMRQIPYTMMKFACFERTVEMLYKYVVPKPRSECSKPEQLVVTFVAGYIAGVFCAIVSHPADSVVSVLNKEKGSTAAQVLKKLGPMGVWKGLVARIIMIGTLTALQWFIYDSVKVYFRLPRPPPPEMPESLKKKLGLT